ncbi:MAG: redoxin domain-containing protein [Bacteroidales bacterium]|nr:redoxin domain-containing protein [Bacteroidales bacterium]
MKRFFIGCVILSFIITSCVQHKTDIIIKGEISGNPPSTLKIIELLPNGSQLIDSASIINGKFKYVIPQKSTSFYQLMFGSEETFLFTAKGGDKLYFTGNFTMGKRTFEMKGSEENDIFMEMNRRLDKCYDVTDSLSKIMKTIMYQDDYLEAKKSIDESYQNTFEEHRQWLITVIKNNSQSLISVMAYYQALGKNRFFNDKEDFNLMKLIHENLQKNFSENIHFEYFSNKYIKTKYELEEYEKNQAALEIGKPIPDYSFFSAEKGVISPSTFKGEKLILFFWSFISKSSIELIPQLKELAKQTQTRVLAISFDTNEENALQFAKKNLTFAYNANEEKMFESQAAKTYDIKVTPAFILVDSEGKIRCRTSDFNVVKEETKKI